MEKEAGGGKRKRRRLPGWLRQIVFSLLFLALALWGAVTSVCVLGRSVYRWHGFGVELRLAPSRVGQTRLVFAPLGEVRARTHRPPVALIASLEEIEIEEVKKLLATTPQRDRLAQEFERVGRADAQNFVVRQVGWGALGALAAPILLRRRRFRAWIAGGIIGAAFVVIMLFGIQRTFDGKAFNTPAYTGTLKATPWAIQFGKDAFTKIEALSTKLRAVAENLNVLYGRINALPTGLTESGPGTTVRILHVSDIHNNLAALPFLREVADQFKVDFIVDTGDLTDFGSPPELLVAQGIAKLPYPYVWVAGNHDSQAVSSALSGMANVIVLNGQPVTVKGVTLIGIPNPASIRGGVGSVDTTPEELANGGNTLLQAVNALSSIPDIVALHDPEESRPLWGRVPLILCGHEHRLYLESHSSPSDNSPNGTNALNGLTILCNAGTTGAAGLRYFEKEKGVPFSCAVVTLYRPAAPGEIASSAPGSSTTAVSANTGTPTSTLAVPTAVPTEPAPTGGAGIQPKASTPISAASVSASLALPPAPSPSPNVTGNTNSPNNVTVSLEGQSVPAHALPRLQLRAIDQIVLDGSLGSYSVSHRTFSARP